MYGVYNAHANNYDNSYKTGKQIPKTVHNQMNWKWMGIFIPLNQLAWGQLRQVKKVCQQNKSIWYGHHSDNWIKEIDKILFKNHLNKFMNDLINCQDCE
jgi:hypothetical protein